MNLSYAELKALIAKKNSAWQYEEKPNFYRVFAVDCGIIYETTLYKDPITVGGLDNEVEATNLADFEDNYKALANFPIGDRPYAFSTPDFQFNGDGILATATKNATTNIDFQIPGAPGSAQYINGAVVITKDAVFGDYAAASIIDIDNILGYGNNVTLANYVTKWYINPSAQSNFETPYAGKLYAGLYIRVTYTSVGAVTDPQIAINYKLHTPL